MAGVLFQTAFLDAGGGPFELDRTTIGLFRTPQLQHRLAVGSDRTREMPIAAGGGWVLPAGASGLCLYDAPLELVTVAFDEKLLSEAGLGRTTDFAPVVGDLDALLTSFVTAAGTWDAADRLYLDTMELALATHLVRQIAPPRPEAMGIEDTRVSRVVEYIHDHLDRQIALSDLAAVAHLSTSQLTRAFRKSTGLSPLQYVIRSRMERAALLLKTTSLPVAEIAHRVGYRDQGRFSRHFAAHHGATPALWRQS